MTVSFSHGRHGFYGYLSAIAVMSVSHSFYVFHAHAGNLSSFHRNHDGVIGIPPAAAGCCLAGDRVMVFFAF